ncbi:hypothetical protein, partial [Pseudomonas syringae group genomosp. 3]|uniref:hypothetical protein n=2 Tax=Pseudomonas syringae group TaxID=136849 RepID=UPI001F2C7567
CLGINREDLNQVAAMAYRALRCRHRHMSWKMLAAVAAFICNRKGVSTRIHKRFSRARKVGGALRKRVPDAASGKVWGSTTQTSDLWRSGMKGTYGFTYQAMLEHIEAVMPLAQTSDPAFMEAYAARSQWIRQTFLLCLWGNALARKKGWQLWGLDAIEYAIINEYSWPLGTVRAMPIRDKWLVLHETLAGLELNAPEKDAWLDLAGEPLGEAGSCDAPWCCDSPGFQLPANPYNRMVL